METYSPAQVAHATGASGASVRNYAKVYAEYMSESANPPKGAAKKFTPDDIKLISFISAQTTQTGAGPTHDVIKQQIDAGALEDFDGPAIVIPEPQQRGRKKGQQVTTQIEKVTGAIENQNDALAKIFLRFEENKQQREDALHQQIAELNKTIADLNWRLGEAGAMVDALQNENDRLRGEGY